MTDGGAKMITAVDIETEGLDATKFIMGSFVIQGKKKAFVTWDKEELWKEILVRGFSEAKRNKVLYVYAHNHAFDSAGYINLYDNNIVHLSNRPFIWTYRLSKQMCEMSGIPINKNAKYKEIIKFLDTFNIYKMSLKKVGELVGMEKWETPSELLGEMTVNNVKNLSKKKKNEIEKYCVRDAQICIRAVEVAKELVNE